MPLDSGGGKLSLRRRLPDSALGDVDDEAGGDGVRYRSRSPFDTGR